MPDRGAPCDPLHLATTKDFSRPLVLLTHPRHMGTGHYPEPLQGISEAEHMAVKFQEKKEHRSAMHTLKHPFANINTFEAAVHSLVRDNVLGCRSYRSARRHHPPVEKVREMYTAKFVYEDEKGKRVGTGSETYHTIRGYHTGLSAVRSNMANIAAHGGDPRHVPEADLFAATLQCNDPDHGLYFLSLARNRVTVSSYTDDAILTRVGTWVDNEPSLK